VSRHRVSRRELLSHLEEQRSFLARSSAAYDSGFEDEAKRLTLTIRVLLHDTAQSQSLLTQLQIKNSLRYTDSADPINPANLLPTPGLVMMQMTTGVGGRYIAPLENLSPNRQGNVKQFRPWWEDPVTKIGDDTHARRDYVLTVANKEGGGHVDPALNQAWVDLTRNNAVGWQYFEESPAGRTETDFEGDLGLASVRQIAGRSWTLSHPRHRQLEPCGWRTYLARGSPKSHR
jgi:hypothetical protein